MTRCGCCAWRRPKNCDPRLGMEWALGDFIEYLAIVSGCDMPRNMQELRDLMRRQPVYRKSGAMGDRFSKHLIYGQNRMPGTQIKIESIREASVEYARQRKEGMEFKQNNYQQKKNERKKS